ncbi:hypothetical protein TNCV_3967581 [Trichonephila clavipes]|nr:hypothetical protein TNCV_3967581 [Trichonephila clavipes]
MTFACVNRKYEESTGSGHMKNLVYKTPVPSVEVLIARIPVTAGRTRDMPSRSRTSRGRPQLAHTLRRSYFYVQIDSVIESELDSISSVTSFEIEDPVT